VDLCSKRAAQQVFSCIGVARIAFDVTLQLTFSRDSRVKSASVGRLWALSVVQVLQCRRRAAELRAAVVRPLRSTVAASVAGRLTDNRHQNSAETNYKAFMTTLLLTGTLVVFWLPYMIFQLLSAHVNPEQSVDTALLFCFWMFCNTRSSLKFVSSST